MSVLYQLGALDAFAQVAGTGVAYVKPHGALYHACITHPEQAEAVATAAHEYDPSLAVLGAPGSPLLGDRRRARDGAGRRGVRRPGVPRRRHARAAERARRRCSPTRTTVAARAVAIATEHSVTAVDGSMVKVEARSICIHGDTPGAVAPRARGADGARGRRRSASTRFTG